MRGAIWKGPLQNFAKREGTFWSLQRPDNNDIRDPDIVATKKPWRGLSKTLQIIKNKKYADLRLSVLGFIFFLPCLGGIFQEENPGENWIESQWGSPWRAGGCRNRLTEAPSDGIPLYPVVLLTLWTKIAKEKRENMSL